MTQIGRIHFSTRFISIESFVIAIRILVGKNFDVCMVKNINCLKLKDFPSLLYANTCIHCTIRTISFIQRDITMKLGRKGSVKMLFLVINNRHDGI